MSVTIFRDVEEALAREVRRITFHSPRTQSRTVLEETFDPFSGEIITKEIEPSFYDSSADASAIQFPHFFIKLIRTREDRFTGRVTPQYGYNCSVQVTSSPKAYEVIASSVDATISVAGDTIQTSIYKIRSVLPGYLIRLLNGNNIGTYIVDSVTPSSTGPHTITLSNNLLINLPSLAYDSLIDTIVFDTPVDLNTIQVGDIFEDASATSFIISAVSTDNNSITLDGSGTPDISSGGKITRTSPILKNSDPSLVRFLVMDPSKPVIKLSDAGDSVQVNSQTMKANSEVPLDAYYLIRIDSKDRNNHVDVLNRVWEEFNPPRTGLPVIVRSALSVDQPLAADVTTGGSPIIDVTNNSKYSVNDTVYLINDFQPTRGLDGKFAEPFKSRVIGKISNNQLQLEDTVPDTFKVSDNTRVITNAEFRLFMFHFVDHVTRDAEGSQYWSHEFVFWTQVWVDRSGDPQQFTNINDTSSVIEDLDGNVLIDDL